MYEDRPGRLLEVLVGLLSGFIGLAFLLSVVYIVLNAPKEIGVIFSIIILISIGAWFSKLSYRLVLNKPKSSGGLMSTRALKFWCIVFILSSMGMIILGLTEKEIGVVVSGTVMIIACFAGLKLANKRAKNV